MSEDRFEIGELVRLTRTFVNLAGTATDPSTVKVRLRSPDGTVTEGDATNDTTAVGVFYFDVTPTVPGRWRYRWVSTGDPQLRPTGTFWVNRDLVGEPAP